MKYKKIEGIFYLAPVVIIVGVLYSMIIWDLVAAFTGWEGLKPTWKFIGFDNFIKIFQMRRFWVNVKNNFIWLFVFIIPTTMLGFTLAYLFMNISRAEKILRQLFLYPMALSFIVTGTLWAWMYDPSSGLINAILKSVGINTSKFGWIANPKGAIYCMIFAAFWQYLGFSLVIYSGAIRGINYDMVEAASMDGANHFRIMFQIIFPNVGHGTLITSTMLAITTMKVFDLVWIMTHGGPGIKTEVLPFFMYRITFSQRHIGMGAATSVIILILSGGIVIPYSLWAIKKWVS